MEFTNLTTHTCLEPGGPLAQIVQDVFEQVAHLDRVAFGLSSYLEHHVIRTDPSMPLGHGAVVGAHRLDRACPQTPITPALPGERHADSPQGAADDLSVWSQKAVPEKSSSGAGAGIHALVVRPARGSLRPLVVGSLKLLATEVMPYLGRSTWWRDAAPAWAVRP